MAGNLGFPGGPMSPVWGGTTLSPESANNPNTVGGGSPYPYGTGMDFGVGSPGFGGSGYPYGTGMDFGVGSPGFPAPAGPDPRIAQEAERNRLEAERNRLEAARGGMNFGLTDIRDNRRAEEEQRRWAEENRRSIEEGGGGLPAYAVETGILQGGYDPGDMGDAATTQGHTDYMRAAQAMYAQTQAEARQREAAAEAERQQFYAYQQQVAANNQSMFNINSGMLNPSYLGQSNPLGGYNSSTGITGAITPIINGAPWFG